MKINKEELRKALEIVKPGLANKELIEQSTSFAFMNERVVTYNDEISISHPVDGLMIEGAVQAQELYQLLSKLKKDDVEITTEDNQIILKASTRSKAGLTLQQEVKLPLEEIGDQSAWKKLPEDFIRHINFAMGSCSRDASRPVLTCIHVNKDGRIESSDGYRITRCVLEENMPVKTFLIPATSAVTLVGLGPTKVAEGKGWVHFQTDAGTVMSCRVFEDEYPDISDFLEVEGVEIKFPRTITEVLDRASVFSKRDHFLDEMLSITLENNRMKVSSKSESGWLEEEVNVRYDDAPISFSIVPYLLKDILEEALTCIICENRLKFEGAGWTYVTILRMD